jgi:hypothetical protein
MAALPSDPASLSACYNITQPRHPGHTSDTPSEQSLQDYLNEMTLESGCESKDCITNTFGTQKRAGDAESPPLAKRHRGEVEHPPTVNPSWVNGYPRVIDQPLHFPPPPRKPISHDRPSAPLPFCCSRVATTRKGPPSYDDSLLMHFTMQTKRHTVFHPEPIHKPSTIGPPHDGGINFIVRVKKLPMDGSPPEPARYFRYRNQVTDREYVKEFQNVPETDVPFVRGGPAVLWGLWKKEEADRELRCSIHTENTYVCEIWSLIKNTTA